MDEKKLEQYGDNSVQIGEISGGNIYITYPHQQKPVFNITYTQAVLKFPKLAPSSLATQGVCVGPKRLVVVRLGPHTGYGITSLLRY